MKEPTLEKMMYWMRKSRREALYFSVIIYTFILFIIQLILFLGYRFLGESTEVILVFKILFFLILGIYLFMVVKRWKSYRFGFKNQRPWNGGIYEGYYKCSKCDSLSGGIYGKGPTQHIIKDSRCVHNWLAIYKKDFGKSFLQYYQADK